MRPIFLTGATGFLGRHVVELLKRQGVGGRLRLLCRGRSPWDADPAVEVVRGDVTSPHDVDRAMEGAGDVLHMAGVVSRDPRDRDLLFCTHIDATRHVCDAAAKHGVKRIVVVSSSGTVAVSREPVVHDENSGYQHEVVARWPYYQSKIYGEKTALGYWDRKQLPVVVVNPALLLGPGDDRGSSTGDIALFLDGQILSMPLGGMSFVDVRDAAAGVIAALARGRPGERYLLGGVNWTFRRIIENVSAISGRRPPLYGLSLPAARAGARLLRLVLPLVGRRFELDDATIEMSAHFWYCNSAKAAAELGFRARDPIETLRVTVEDIRRRRKAAAG
jgi:dihydroflavonol-4-reductase